MESITGTFQIINRGASYSGGKVTQESVSLSAVNPDGEVQLHGNLTILDAAGRSRLPDGSYRVTVELIDESKKAPAPTTT